MPKQADQESQVQDMASQHQSDAHLEPPKPPTALMVYDEPGIEPNGERDLSLSHELEPDAMAELKEGQQVVQGADLNREALFDEHSVPGAEYPGIVF